MIRKIIKINKDKCNGCGACVIACHEGAIKMFQNKATLVREDYCDGLGDCLPACPTGAITFEIREALDYNEEAVQNAKNENKSESCGCPGSQSKVLKNDVCNCCSPYPKIKSELLQWPVQIKLVPINAPYFNNADILIAADCTAYAYGNFHKDFMHQHITLIGCPKLDEGSYIDKLCAIISNNNIRSIKVARMEVPCCGGIEHTLKQALVKSNKNIPLDIIVISRNGKIL